MRFFVALAAIVIAAGCRRTENADRRGDTTVAPPVSVDTISRSEALDCGITGTAVISDEAVGELKVGRSVEDIRALCDILTDAQELGSEGMQERVVVVRIAGEPVRAVIRNNKVWRVEITSPRIKTVDSLGVDTPLHAIATKPGAEFHPGEDGVYGFVAVHCALSFRFSIPLRPPRGSGWTPEAIDKAHGDAAVDKVLLTQCRR